MEFKTITTSKDFAEKHGIYHQTVIKAVERMRKAIAANPNKYRGAGYMETHFIPSEHIVNNRKHFCYAMTAEACSHILLYLSGRKITKAQLEKVREFYRMLESYKKYNKEHDLDRELDMYECAFTRN